MKNQSLSPVWIMFTVSRTPFTAFLAGALLALAPTAEAAQQHLLKEKPPTCVAVEVKLEVRGKLLIEEPVDPQKDEEDAGPKIKKLPLTVDGMQQFHQRLLPDVQGRREAARHYTKTTAKITVDQQTFAPQLAADRRLVRVAVEGGELAFRSPQGPLSREEQEIVEVQGNPLLLHRLLPDQEVELKQAWAIDANAVAPIFGLDRAFSGSLEGRLLSVEGKQARISVKGDLDGAVDGVPSRVECEATLEMDLELQLITRFDATFEEQREISGGLPGVDATSRLRTTVEPASIPESLETAALAKFPPSESSDQLLRYTAPGEGFSLMHSPAWRVVRDTPKRTTLRLLDGGDVVAQANLSALKPIPTGKRLTLDEFVTDVRDTLKKLKGQVTEVETTDLGTTSKLQALRVMAEGKVQEVGVVWIYMHVSDKEGQRVSAVFTMEKKRQEKFAGADVSLLSGLTLAEAPLAETAKTKEPQTK